MKDYVLILMGTMLVNNLVLVKFLGLCPLMGVSRRQETALGMGLATTFVLTLSSTLSHLLYALVLKPFDLTYLKTLVFIVIIGGVVQFTEHVVRRSSPLLYQVLGIFLPLITTNCAVLGVALLNVQEEHTFLESILYGLGASLGFTLVIVLFAGVRERIDASDVPEVFRGHAVSLITAGILSLAFMGFQGMGRV